MAWNQEGAVGAEIVEEEREGTQNCEGGEFRTTATQALIKRQPKSNRDYNMGGK